MDIVESNILSLEAGADFNERRGTALDENVP